MDTSRLTLGEMVAAAGGTALLLVMLVFDWFTVADDPTGLGDRNAWEALSVIDLVLFLVCAVAVGMAAARAIDADLRALPLSPGLLVGCCGLLAFALVAYRLAVVPDLRIEYPGATENVEEAGGTVNRAFGLYPGLAAAAAIAVGGLMARRERLSVVVRAHE